MLRTNRRAARKGVPRLSCGLDDTLRERERGKEKKKKWRINIDTNAVLKFIIIEVTGDDVTYLERVLRRGLFDLVGWVTRCKINEEVNHVF